MDISNKTLAFFLVTAIVVSIAGTMISLNKITSFEKGTATGLVADSGNVNLTVLKVASIRFANSSCNWGTGFAEAGTYCTMETNGSGSNSAGCNGFDTVSECTILENNGSAKVNVTLNFSNNETIFGPKPVVGGIFQYNVTNYETGSCTDWTDVTANGTQMWTDVGDWYATEPLICANLSTGDTEDTIRIDWKVGFNNAVTQATLTTNITATAESIE